MRNRDDHQNRVRDVRLRRRAGRRTVLVGRGRPSPRRGADSGFASMGFAARRDVKGWAQVEPADEPTWVFAQVPEPKAGKNRLHLDVVAKDVEAEIARLVGLGATRVTDHEEYGYTWTLM